MQFGVLKAGRNNKKSDDPSHDLSGRFWEVGKQDVSISGVLVLLARAEEMHGATWGVQFPSAHLWQLGAACWKLFVKVGMSILLGKWVALVFFILMIFCRSGTTLL